MSAKTLMERLRWLDEAYGHAWHTDWAREAADEIERLEHALAGIPHDWVALQLHEGVLAERDALRAALLLSPCPRPIGDGETVADCLKSGNCGCDNRAALEGSK